MTTSTSKVESGASAAKGKETPDAKKKGGNISRTTNRATIPYVKFDGKCDDLKGHIYDCSGSKQADLFAKTTREIAIYVGSTYKPGGDISFAVDNLELPIIEDPVDPPEGCT